MPTIQELERKLRSVRREVRNLTVMGMDPKQPPDQLALIKQLEISARAEQRLRKMALDYERSRTKS
jgi:hypothetical protein